VQTDRKTGELLLLFPEGVLHLSETAGDILNRCDGTRTIGMIISDLSAEYEAAPEMIRKDVLDSLLELHQRMLVVL